MDSLQTSRFIEDLRELTSLSRRYTLDEFDPSKTPSNFGSLDALRTTRNKLYGLIRTASAGSTQNGIISHMTDKDRLKIELARSGFDLDLVLDTLIKGPCYGQQRFIGRIRLSKDKWQANTSRRNSNFDKKAFLSTFTTLVKEKLVTEDGGFSLNPHLEDVQNEILRRTLQYVLDHNPIEEKQEE